MIIYKIYGNTVLSMGYFDVNRPFGHFITIKHLWEVDHYYNKILLRSLEIGKCKMQNVKVTLQFSLYILTFKI